MHLSEGYRSDMLLDLSGLTREERVMVQASNNNERDSDKVADALIIQYPRIHLREGRKRVKGEANLQEKDKHTGNGKLGASQVPVMQTSLLLMSRSQRQQSRKSRCVSST